LQFDILSINSEPLRIELLKHQQPYKILYTVFMCLKNKNVNIIDADNLIKEVNNYKEPLDIIYTIRCLEAVNIYSYFICDRLSFLNYDNLLQNSEICKA
jgi:hypothetical protein